MQAYQYRGKFYTIRRNAYQEWLCDELQISRRLWRDLKRAIEAARDRELQQETNHENLA